MTLRDLPQPLYAAQLEGYALVFGDTLAGRLADVWRQHGTTNCVPIPLRMTDGRWLLWAGLLIETRPGGTLERMWLNVDQAAVLDGVEVITVAEAKSLLPKQPVEP